MKIARRHSMTPDIEPERWALINFTPPGAPSFTVDLRTCPLGSPRFSHWRSDGSCECRADA